MRTATTRTISGRVNADGTIANGSEFTVHHNGTGNYVLTFAGQRLRSLTTSGGSGAFPSLPVADTFDTNTCRIVVANAGATAAVDGPFNFTATVAA
jgi:hypothetical protein